MKPRVILLVAATLIALGVAPGAGCRRSRGQAPPGKVEGLAKTALGVLPVDTGIIAGVSWARFRETSFWASVEPHVLGEGEVKDWVDLVKELCRIDVVANLDAVLLAVPDSLDENRVIAMVKGTWSEEEVDRCLVAIADKGAGTKLTVTKDGKLTRYQARVTDRAVNMWVAWIESDTVLITMSGLEGDRRQLDELLAATTHAADSEALQPLLEHVDTTQTGWAVIVKPEQAGDTSKYFDLPSGGSLAGFYASGKLDRALSGYVGIRFDSDKSAKRALKKGALELKDLQANPIYGSYLANARMRAFGKDVVVTGEVPEDILEKLAERVAKMTPEDLEKLVQRITQLTAQGAD